MDKLNVQLAKARASIERAVRKRVPKCSFVSVGFDHWEVRIHVWNSNNDITHSFNAPRGSTIKQIVRVVHKELRQGVTVEEVFDEDILF